MLTQIWAHRGASAYAPENTLAAFGLAAEMGANGIELDVHMSRDGSLVVVHDEKVNRTSNGSGYVKDMTLAELKKFNFSEGSKAYPQERIPTLKEVYELIAQTDIKINVELKCDKIIYEGLWDKLIELEQQTKMQGRILYSSFNWDVLTKLLNVDNGAKVGLLYKTNIKTPWKYAAELGACALHPKYLFPLRTPELISACHERGFLVHAWTVNEPSVMQKLALAKIDAIITNKPDIALRVLHSLKENCNLN